MDFWIKAAAMPGKKKASRAKSAGGTSVPWSAMWRNRARRALATTTSEHRSLDWCSPDS